MNAREKGLSLWDTISSVLWLLMDAVLAAQCLMLPTTVAALVTFRYTERSAAAYAITGAMNAWLLMNISWMLSEFHTVQAMLTASRWLFATGVVLLLTAFGVTRSARETFASVLTRFRRFRISA